MERPCPQPCHVRQDTHRHAHPHARDGGAAPGAPVVVVGGGDARSAALTHAHPHPRSFSSVGRRAMSAMGIDAPQQPDNAADEPVPMQVDAFKVRLCHALHPRRRDNYRRPPHLTISH